MIFAVWWFAAERRSGPDRSGNLPWRIEVLDNGRSQVFGITLGNDELDDVRRIHGDGYRLALIGSDDAADLSLEMFYERFNAGPLGGSLIVAAALDRATLVDMQSRATDQHPMRSGAIRFDLADADLALALQAPVASLTFVPSVSIDAAVLVQRFGAAEQQIETQDGVRHFLYPDRGLDLIVNEHGREALQYVAPRDFARLREPLRRYEEH